MNPETGEIRNFQLPEQPPKGWISLTADEADLLAPVAERERYAKLCMMRVQQSKAQRRERKELYKAWKRRRSISE